MFRKPRRWGFEKLENRRLLAANLIQIDSFATWDGVIPSTDVAGIAYHSGSEKLYLADSEINETPVFDGNNIFVSSLDGDTLEQEIASNNDEPTGIAFNEFDGFFYVTSDKTSAKGILRYDTNLNNPLAIVNTDNDVPGSTDPEGITADPSNGLLYVVDGISGGMRVLIYDSNLVFQDSFSLPAQMSDAEGIAISPVNGNLFIVSDPDASVFEFSVTGSLLNQFDISGFSPTPNAPQGLTFAPTSDPNDDVDQLALYIADGGFDEFPDGRVYEAHLTCHNVGPNCAPQVSSGGDQTIVVTDLGLDVAFLDGTVVDDDLPAPPNVVTQWSQVSGPGIVSFADSSAIDTTASFTDAGTYVVRLSADDGELISFDEATLVVIEQPADVTIEESRVQASSDDAEEKYTGGMKLPNSDLELVFDDGGNQKIGMRFVDVDVPPGATIVNAYVQFQADETNSGVTLLAIEGEASDDAPTFAPLFANISSRPRTNTSTFWSPSPWTSKGDAGPDQQTPNIASVIQEIVDRPGWSSGNALAIIVTGTGERVAESYDGDQDGAPLLHIEFTTNISPTATNLTQLHQYTEGTGSVALDDIVVTDPDTGETITAQLTLSNVATGSLSTGTFGATTSTYNPGTGLWEAIGTVTDVNAALADVAFLPVLDNDVDTIVNTHVEDQAGTGPTDGIISLIVTQPNNPPAATNLTQLHLYTEGAASVALDDIVVTDPDVGETITAQLTLNDVTTGTLSTGTFGATTSTYNPGTGLWEAIGTVTDVNAALSDVEFLPLPDNDLDTTIDTHVEDLEGTGPVDGVITLDVNAVNDPPLVNDQLFAIDENSSINTLVGTVVASDPDSAQTLSFDMIAGNESGAFAIDSVTGEIRVADSLPLDFETTPSFDLTVEVSDDGVPSLADTAIITINLNDVVENPVTIESRVQASSDDAEEKPSGGMKLPNKDLEMVFDNGIQQVGMRFIGVAVPPGATIVNAYVQFKADETDSGPTLLTIEAEASDDAATFTSVVSNISSRPRTTSSATWSPAPWTQRGAAGLDQRTPDMSAVIQEIVDRPNWSDGNAIVIIVTGSGERVAESYDGDQAGAPLLHVEYTGGQAAGGQAAGGQAAGGQAASAPLAIPAAASQQPLAMSSGSPSAASALPAQQLEEEFIAEDVMMNSELEPRTNTIRFLRSYDSSGTWQYGLDNRSPGELADGSTQLESDGVREVVFAELGRSLHLG